METGTLELLNSQDGYGSGSGYGDGDGYGYGYGSGYGSGEERTEYLNAVAHPHATEGTVIAFWRSHSDGTPANGGSGTKATPGLTETIPGPLKLCSCRALHATLDPREWKGERWWLVALAEPVARDGAKLGSLKRTILTDLGKCPF